MKRIINVFILLLAISLSIFSSSYAWQSYMQSPWTRDGKIKSEIIKISSEVSGKIVEISVKDNQFVKKGDLLFKIDQKNYKNAYDKALNDVKESESQLLISKNIYNRDIQLPKDLISEEQITENKLKVEKDLFKLNSNKAILKEAKDNLSRTKIYSPKDGYITNLNQRVGNYITVNESLVALLEKNSFYVVAYFEEIKMPKIKINKKVKITPISGISPFFGEIESIGRAVQDDSSNNSGLIPKVNQTVPWIRLSQRIPVRIKIIEINKDAILISGTTATIEVID
ncbi:MAG: efflux transporter periplasmic adaptor subunit [Chloroflexi bacterium]|nr:efflux transporter periplasmic adaptor subunit [Chloroflexota bacterium]|tara:strand:- start:27117 stop:27968 length:852 start_codon:yes stop_codon:yes gene_type:complete